MVKYLLLMISPAQSVSPTRPSLMKSLKAGFDAISAQIGVILLPILLDVVLWFGPRLRLVKLFEAALQNLGIQLSPMQDQAFLEPLLVFFREWNLLSSLRTFPVGIPSLMMDRLSLETPWGTAQLIDISSFSTSIAIWLICTVVGLLAGAFFFLWIAHAAISGTVNFRTLIRQWPFTSLQLGILSLLWILFSFVASLPLSCLFSLLLVSGFAMEQGAFFIGLIYLSILILGVVPLAFSIHGVVARQERWWRAMRTSMRVSYMTMPHTSLLFLVLILLSMGLDVLWNVPPNSSWWALVGVIGHAFVATSLIAASFVYYNEALVWMNAALQHSPNAPRWSEK